MRTSARNIVKSLYKQIATISPPCLSTYSLGFSTEYPPEPTRSYDEQTEDYDPYAPAPNQVTMITEDAYPYATTTESYDYAKEDITMATQVKRSLLYQGQGVGINTSHETNGGILWLWLGEFVFCTIHFV